MAILVICKSIIKIYILMYNGVQINVFVQIGIREGRRGKMVVEAIVEGRGSYSYWYMHAGLVTMVQATTQRLNLGIHSGTC